MGNLARKYIAAILLDPPVQQNCLTIVVTLYNKHNMLLLSLVIQLVVSLNREMCSVSWDVLRILMPVLANSDNSIFF
jgi:membrane-anchored protein YejM (alkaline phosphatase superfamily)